MTDLIPLESEESQDVGSLNHSFTQARLITLLSHEERFTTFVELSLDVSQTDLTPFGLKTKEEFKPDVCLYEIVSGYPEPDPQDDVLRVSQMPTLAIEIISPKQSIDDILSKFKVYFALGIKSCWLVTPAFESITVYSGFRNFKLFDVRRDAEVIDDVLDIHLPLGKIFRKVKT
jgi:Uma2 family endonuclease